MQLSPRNVCLTIALLLLSWIEAASVKNEYRCPIGFQLSFTFSGSPICHRQKEPETFSDKFEGCIGNLYTSKLYLSLNFTKPKQVVWTEYKSLYPGGPFVDWSYTESTGHVLSTTFEVKYDSALGLDEELCVVIDPVSNYTAARCDEKHYRYCFVKPYPDEDDMSTKGCKKDFWRFHSPVSTCLSAVTGVGGGPVRATWRQAQELCGRRTSLLMFKGWRYSNCPMLHTSGSHPYYPLGIVRPPDTNVLRYDNDYSEVPSSEWNLHKQLTEESSDADYGAIFNEFWRLVNVTYVFFDVICEQPVPLKSISLNIVVDWENRMVLRVNDTIRKSDIYCYTDSNIYYPSDVSVSSMDDDDFSFRVIPGGNGYYWCLQKDQKNYHVSESKRALFIRSKESVLNLYACKIRLRKEYRFQKLDKLRRIWTKKLEEYIYYRTKYIQVFGELPANGTEDVLQEFKKTRPELDWKSSDVIFELKIRRVYLDAKTVLVHIELNPEMMPANPGTWEILEVIFMKPAYFCKGFDSVPMKEMGESATTVGCRTYSCVGDFNEGVQWVETATKGCVTRPSTTILTTSNIEIEDSVSTALSYWDNQTEKSSEQTVQIARTVTVMQDDDSSSEENSPCYPKKPPCSEKDWPFTTINNIVETTEPVTTDPNTEFTTEETVTSSPLPPDEKLQQVVLDLENLLLGSEPVPIESISQPFDQVNSVLEVEDQNLEIPGQLLHLLDELASKVRLDGFQAMEVRDNVALLMADATPEHPVRGVRVAARDYDVFSNTSFGFIDGQLDSDQLLRNTSEAVVYLPASVSAQPRRISFVAFRNQRAFRSSVSVNSRVFSVNVENLTHFEDGEVIDIHLSPIVENPDRNESRVCAYWKFTSNGSGYWSQDGCTLIRSTTPGVMDTCRCTHLTHFAEILVSRSVFSEQDEAALEVLSIIGCCLSIFGLFMILLTAALFRSWRKDYSNKIWLQLCIAICILIICFLVTVFAHFEYYNITCMLIGVALHYSVLASFCWMLVAAVLSYRRLVLVFTRDFSHKLLRASAFAWGTPCLIVGILLSVDPQSYQGQFEAKSPSGVFCYPSGLGLWLAVYAPIAVMLLANWTLFALIVRSVFASRRIQRHGDSNEALRCASVSCLLVFLFGLPWIFGLFAYNVVGAYLFTIFGTCQGVVLFIFFVLGNKKTRDLWLNKLKIKQTRKVPVTSSTFTNRSTGPGWRGGAEGSSTPIEAKTSKPRSLASQDDSRFS